MNPDSNLNSLARTLAERLIAETDNFGDCSLEIALEKAEAVIREAIEKTLDEAEKAVDELGFGDGEHNRFDKAIIAACDAIHALKPAKVTNP